MCARVVGQVMGVPKRKRPATAVAGKKLDPRPPVVGDDIDEEDVAMEVDEEDPAEDEGAAPSKPKLSKSQARKRRQVELKKAKEAPSVVGDATSFLDLFVYMTSPVEKQRQTAAVSLVKRVKEAESKVVCCCGHYVRGMGGVCVCVLEVSGLNRCIDDMNRHLHVSRRGLLPSLT